VPFLAALIPAGAAAAGAAGAGTAAAGTLLGSTTLASVFGTGLAGYAGLAGTAGSLISAGGSILGGNDANAAAQANAKMLDTQAQQEMAAAKSKANQGAISDSRAIEGARADYGSSGVETSGGSPLTVLNENIRNAQLNSMYTRLTGNATAYNLEQQADIERQRGKQAQGAGFINAGSGLLTGIGGALSRGSLLSSWS
jgi:hypothetical protein